MMLKRVGLFLCLSLFCLCAQALEFKIITLQHRFASDIIPTIQSMVGDDGNVSGIDNQLLVRASPERMAMIEQIVATLDSARKNLRITVSHEDMRQSNSNQAGVSGNARIGNTDINVGRPSRGYGQDNLEIDIGQHENTTSQSGSEFITVSDGGSAFIRVGQSVPFTQQWLVWTQQYAHIQQATVYQDITTGFAVRPRMIGGQVELEVSPRISSLSSGDVIDFQALSTVVRVTPGQWFDLGGAMQTRDNVSRAILSGQGSSGSQQSRLMIKVDE
jgi:type II secretory pathway component GspD/PulD (secretin)